MIPQSVTRQPLRACQCRLTGSDSPNEVLADPLQTRFEDCFESTRGDSHHTKAFDCLNISVTCSETSAASSCFPNSVSHVPNTVRSCKVFPCSQPQLLTATSIA